VTITKARDGDRDTFWPVLELLRGVGVMLWRGVGQYHDEGELASRNSAATIIIITLQGMESD